MRKKTPDLAQSYEEEAHPAEGVVRLTKLPLVAVGLLLLIAMCALIYAVSARHQPSSGSGNLATYDMTAAQSILDASKGYREIIQGYEQHADSHADRQADSHATPIAEVVPTTTATATATVIKAKTEATGPDEQHLEQHLEEEQLRYALLRDAIVSATRVELEAPAAALPLSGGLSSLGIGGNNFEQGAFEKDAFEKGYVEKSDPLSQGLSALLSGAQGATPEALPADPNLRGRKEDYLREAASYSYSPQQRLDPIAPFELKVGTVIPAILDTQINSDLPGMIIAHVSRPVRDTRTGRAVLIPAGAKLIGDYDQHIATGQKRLLVIWRRVQFPDASTLALEKMPGLDARGQAGFQDKVDNHYWRTFGSALLLSVISAAAQQSQGDIQTIDEAGRRTFTRQEALSAELGRQWGELGRETIKKNFDIQPSLVIRPGFRFNVLVNKDLILPPYFQ